MTPKSHGGKRTGSGRPSQNRKSQEWLFMRAKWHQIKHRCYKPYDTSFHNYGGRGIKMCDRWLASFEAFFEDLGPRPSKRHSVDRIDNDGNYEPGNCRWATMKEQCANLRKTIYTPFNGEMVPLPVVADKLGLKQNTVLVRLRRGWKPEDVTCPRRLIHKRFEAKNLDRGQVENVSRESVAKR